MSTEKKYTQIGQYLLSKKGKPYVKFGPRRDKDGNVVGENIFPLTINEGDVANMDMFTDEFREKYNIKDFNLGNLKFVDEGEEEFNPDKEATPKKSKPNY